VGRRSRVGRGRERPVSGLFCWGRCAEEVIGSSGGGERGAEFGPDHAVAEGEEGAEDPAEHGLRAAHGGEDEREGDEGADADHVEHVEGDCAAERQGAVKLRLRIGGGERNGFSVSKWRDWTVLWRVLDDCGCVVDGFGWELRRFVAVSGSILWICSHDLLSICGAMCAFC